MRVVHEKGILLTLMKKDRPATQKSGNLMRRSDSPAEKTCEVDTSLH